MLRGRDRCGNGRGARYAGVLFRALPCEPPEATSLLKPDHSFGVDAAAEAALAGLAAKNV